MQIEYLDKSICSRLHSELGKLMLRRGADTRDVRKQLEAALRLDDDNVAASLALAEICQGQNPELADEVYAHLEAKAMNMYSGNGKTLAHTQCLVDIADYHRRAGNAARAKLLWEAARDAPSQMARDIRTRHSARPWTF